LATAASASTVKRCISCRWTWAACGILVIHRCQLRAPLHFILIQSSIIFEHCAWVLTCKSKPLCYKGILRCSYCCNGTSIAAAAVPIYSWSRSISSCTNYDVISQIASISVNRC
jgi:hypothetical protein